MDQDGRAACRHRHRPALQLGGVPDGRAHPAQRRRGAHRGDNRGRLGGRAERAAGREPDDVEELDDSLQDLERYARDLISKRISQRFKAHKFERLVDELLQAQGYVTERTTAGADGGVDIVVGRGPMGFDEPRIAVQVKGGEGPEDFRAVRELQGVLRNFNVQRGLFVSWGGFRSSVTSAKRNLFFEVRVWTADDVIDAVLENYDRLSDQTKSELPLMRIWTLVPSPEAD